MARSNNSTHSLDLDRAFSAANEAANLAQKILLDYFGHLSHVQEKEMAGLVSEADLESEKVITTHLLSNFPHSEILGEEDSFAKGEIIVTSGAMGRWIVDPLDGTTNYIHKLPLYCISIGYEWQGEMVLGLIDVPSLGDRYWALKGRGAFKNGQPIYVSQRSKIGDSLLATGFFPPNAEALTEQIRIFSHLIGKVRGMRRLGAAALDLCLVAEGVFEGFWEKNLQPWDTAAGFLIVEEAGGVVSGIEGNKYSPFDKAIVAGNSKIQPKLLELIQETIEELP